MISYWIVWTSLCKYACMFMQGCTQHWPKGTKSAQSESHQDVWHRLESKSFLTLLHPLNMHTRLLAFTHCCDYMLIYPSLVLQRPVRKRNNDYIHFNQKEKGFSVSNQARERCSQTPGLDRQVLLLLISGNVFPEWLKKSVIDTEGDSPPT